MAPYVQPRRLLCALTGNQPACAWRRMAVRPATLCRSFVFSPTVVIGSAMAQVTPGNFLGTSIAVGYATWNVGYALGTRLSSHQVGVGLGWGRSRWWLP